MLLHINVPAIGLVATQWAVINWSKAQFAREGITDSTYMYRCGLIPGTNTCAGPANAVYVTSTRFQAFLPMCFMLFLRCNMSMFARLHC